MASALVLTSLRQPSIFPSFSSIDASSYDVAYFFHAVAAKTTETTPPAAKAGKKAKDAVAPKAHTATILAVVAINVIERDIPAQNTAFAASFPSFYLRLLTFALLSLTKMRSSSIELPMICRDPSTPAIHS